METPPLFELRCLSPLAWIQRERERQEEKWGPCDHGAGHFLAVLTEEFGEVSKVLNESWEGKLTPEEYHRLLEYELIQVAAVAVKWIEAIRKNGHTAAFLTCQCGKCQAPTGGTP